MPRLIKGTELNPEQRHLVLRTFAYRWTIENYNRAAKLFAPHGGPPAYDPMTDDEWLSYNSFWHNEDGSLTKGRMSVWTGPTQVGSTTKEAK